MYILISGTSHLETSISDATTIPILYRDTMPHRSHSKHNSTGEAKLPRKSNLVNGHHPNPLSDIDFDITVANCPPTHRVPAIHADEYIEKPGIARGNLAASTDNPHGDEEYSRKYRKFVSTPLCPRRVEKTQQLTKNKDSIATTCPFLGPRRRWPDLPLGHIYRFSRIRF